MFRHGREATITLLEASWIDGEISSSQKMGISVLLVCSVWSFIYIWRWKPYGSRALTSVMEQE